MKLSEIMSHAGLARYAEIALILFLLAFVAVVIAIFRPGAKREMDEASRLPFDDDSALKPRNGGQR